MKCSCDHLPGPPAAPKSYRAAHRLIGPVLHATGLSCRRFTELSLRRMDGKLPLLPRLAWMLHWLVCSLCRPMPGRLARLRALMREADRRGGLADPEARLPEEARQRLLETLRRESEA